MARRSPLRARILKPVSQASNALGESVAPIDLLSEITFSVLILLTFTLAFRILKFSGNPTQALSSGDLKDLMFGALGAILAWGLIDGVMYALLSLFERGESQRLFRDVQMAKNEQEAVAIIAYELDYILEPITHEADRQALYPNVLKHLRNSQPRQVGFTRQDILAVLSHLLIALLAVLPSFAPFILFQQDYTLALRLSNGVSLIVLFLTGYYWGKYTGANPLKTGLLLLMVALMMVLIAIPLGG